MGIAPKGERLGLEAGGLDLPRQAQRLLGVGERLLELHQGNAAAIDVHVGDQLGAPMPDLGRHLHRRKRLVQRLPDLSGIEQGGGHHRAIGDLDAPEAMGCGKLDAAAEVPKGGSHPSAHIFGIAKPAQCRHLEFGRPGLARQGQASAVLAQTPRHIAAWEHQVAVQQVGARSLLGEAQLLGDPLACATSARAPSTSSVMRLTFAKPSKARHRSTSVSGPRPKRQRTPPGRRRSPRDR